jgi:hypothetical protein
MLIVACSKSEPSPSPVASSMPAASPVGLVTPTLDAPRVAALPSSEKAPASTAPSKYAVFGVKADDVLNVRAEPDHKSKKVYSYGPSVTAISGTGRQVVSGGVPWLEVAFDSGTGWVNRTFLREVVPGGGCNDPALTALIRKVMRAVALSDGASLQDTVSPLRGLLVRQTPASPTVRIPPNEAGGLFTSPTPKSWGADVGSFKQVILPSLREDVAGKGAQETCGKLLAGGTEQEFPAELAGLTLVSFHRPASGARSWHTTVGGLEYVEGKPYLTALVQYEGGAATAAVQ